MLESFIKFCVYGGVLYLLLEPHAHLWPHPDVMKFALPRAKKAAPAKKKAKKR